MRNQITNGSCWSAVGDSFMSDWIAFDGRVVPLEWGNSIYTVLPLPDDVYRELKAQSAKRVDVELNDCPFNLALTKAPVLDQVFLYTGKKVLAEASIEPGDTVDVRLRKADPDFVAVPDDVLLAIRQSGVIDVWNALSAGRKRSLLHLVLSAKRDQTRKARIEKTVAELRSL